MDAEERADNLARQAEEAEALSAIYGEDFAIEDGAWTVRVPLSRDPELGADGELLPAYLIARLVPLETYPSRACFLAEVGPSGALHVGELERLAREADAAYAEAPGEVAAFAFVERLREACASAADAEDAPEDARAPADRETPDSRDDSFDPEALASELAAIDAGRAFAESSPACADADDADDARDIDPSRVCHGAPFVERKSTFQAHVLLRLRSPAEADAFATYLKRDPKVARRGARARWSWGRLRAGRATTTTTASTARAKACRICCGSRRARTCAWSYPAGSAAYTSGRSVFSA